MTKTEAIFLRLTLAQLQELDGIVDRTIGNRSDHVRKAVDEYIERYRNASLLPSNGHASTIAPSPALVNEQ